jgi:hypothetical protein
MPNNLTANPYELATASKLQQQKPTLIFRPSHHFRCPSIGDVALHLYNTFYRGHWLQVNCDDERKVAFPSSISITQQNKEEQNEAIRYPNKNYARTNGGTLALTLTCNQEIVLLVHTGSGSKPTVTIGESSNQTKKKTLVLGKGTRIPGSSFREQHTGQPHASLLV